MAKVAAGLRADAIGGIGADGGGIGAIGAGIGADIGAGSGAGIGAAACG